MMPVDFPISLVGSPGRRASRDNPPAGLSGNPLWPQCLVERDMMNSKNLAVSTEMAGLLRPNRTRAGLRDQDNAFAAKLRTHAGRSKFENRSVSRTLRHIPSATKQIVFDALRCHAKICLCVMFLVTYSRTGSISEQSGQIRAVPALIKRKK